MTNTTRPPWDTKASVRFFCTSHYPYSEELMQLADREGFVIIDEVPAVGMCFWTSKPVFDGTRVSQWLDVICLNRYMGWYSDHGHLEVIGLQVKNELNEWYTKFGKPIIMTECGADTIAGLHKFPR